MLNQSPIKTKTCRVCHIEKDISCFYKTKGRSRDGHINKCKTCVLSTTAEYYKNNKSEKNSYTVTYLRKRRYGITKDEYNKLLLKQNGVCAICGKPETNINKSQLSVDHDHKTHAVRGLLCASCNAALGYAGDDPDNLDKMANYLRSCDSNSL